MRPRFVSWLAAGLSLHLLSVAAQPASAAALTPTSYDMPNGQTGAFDYFDQSYNGSGDHSVKLSPLSGGLGELTDGQIPTQSWNENHLPFVGWLTVNPTISFRFGQMAEIHDVKLYFDDTEGQGGVEAPSSVQLSDGTHSVTVPVVDTPDHGQLLVDLPGLSLLGDHVDVTITKGNKWFMLSEVKFDGQLVPEPSHLSFAFAALATLVPWCRRRG